MPKKATDPFMAGLWNALVADALGPASHATGWDETPVRIRNRFTRAVRQVLQSGAAFQASALGLHEGPATGARAAKPAPAPAPAPASARPRRGKRHDPRELQLPLMSSVSPSAAAKKKGH